MKQLMLVLLFCSISVSAAAAEYRLGAGDLVKIVVYDEPDLSLETRIDSVGVIHYPFIGKLMLMGKSVDEVKGQLVNKLKDGYLINPEVTVTIVDYRQFFVNGRVKRPGGFPYRQGMTVQKSISLAGGFDARANKEEIYLTRGENSERTKTTMDTIVQPGDVITIVDYRQFFVNGRVRRPGGFPYQPGMTVQKSISLAGGFDTRANKKEIYLTRGENGESTKTTMDTIVQPGDVITVERGFF